MKQITDKLNKIAQAIDESVELPTTDLIIDSLDAITTAYGGTPVESNLIVDKLETIAGVAHGGITPTGNIEITENGENINVAPYATATVNVAGGGDGVIKTSITFDNTLGSSSQTLMLSVGDGDNILEDGVLLMNKMVTVPVGESLTLDFIVTKKFSDYTVGYHDGDIGTGTTADYSAIIKDLVNVTIDAQEDSGTYYYIGTITDITKESSLRIVLSQLE